MAASRSREGCHGYPTFANLQRHDAGRGCSEGALLDEEKLLNEMGEQGTFWRVDDPEGAELFFSARLAN